MHLYAKYTAITLITSKDTNYVEHRINVTVAT